jgi:hypothetical protein
MKQLLIVGFTCTFINISAQQINCDSLKKQFNIEIEQAKKNGADNALLNQLEMVKKQTLDMFCNGNKIAVSSMPNNSKTNRPNNNKEANELEVGNSQKSMFTKTLQPLHFIAAHKITIQIKASSTENNETFVYDYYINKEGNKLLVDKAGFEKAGKLYEMGEGESGEFIAWLIESTGKSIMYSLTKEKEKIAIINGMNNYLMSEKNKNKMSIKALPGTKNIAGYSCKGFLISGVENGEKVNLNCWATITPLPLQHSSFPMFSMFSASSIGLPVAANCGVLQIEGTTGNEKMNIQVINIQQTNKTFDFVGFKGMSIGK